ncbi:hypothetical protein [Alteromonas sp. a30]|uniref:hypothetical protein n=1 Tax=Alteromonas sp. a30 TaxID=2730917 RepID=UPI00227E8836|nr:hypothetical protein [Alteromonas sp. a30]MCY7296496.1 hypothetical protein [Alteromonas sp. a30]
MDNEQIKNKLKSYFQSGDVPTEAQFGELIDEAISSDASRLSEGTLAAERLPKQVDLNMGSGEGESTLTATFVSGNELNANTMHSGHMEAQSVKAGSVSSNTLTVEKNISAKHITATFSGDGQALTQLQANHISDGELNVNRLPKQLNLTTHEQPGDAMITTHMVDTYSLTSQHLQGQTLDSMQGNIADFTSTQISADNITVTNLQANMVEAKLVGDGAGVSNINPANISGRIKSEQLYLGTKTALGVVQFATQDDITNNADNRAVTAKAMNQTIQQNAQQTKQQVLDEARNDAELQVQTAFKENRAYVDAEVASLQANITQYEQGEGIIIDGNTISTNPTWFINSLESSTIVASSVIGTLDIAQVPHTDSVDESDNKVPTAKAVQEYVSEVVSQVPQAPNMPPLPPKTAIPFWGTQEELTPGWAICDGGVYNGVATPDLRTQFIRGAQNDAEVGNVKTYSTALPQAGLTIEANSHAHHVSAYHANATTLGADLSANIRALNTEPASDSQPLADGPVPVNTNEYLMPLLQSDGKFIDVDGSGGIAGRVSNDSEMLDPSVEHQHEFDIALEAKDTEATSHTHNLLGGDDETAPPHILMYWITWVGVPEI